MGTTKQMPSLQQLFKLDVPNIILTFQFLFVTVILLLILF